MQINDISTHAVAHFGIAPQDITAFAPSGSQRRYFRLHFDQDIAENARTVIAAYNENVAENQLFIAYTQHFLQQGVRVPQIFHVSHNEKLYFQQDLGNTTLLEQLQSLDKANYNQLLTPYYEAALSDLAFIQTVAGKNLDFSRANTHTRFDATVMGWDLSYFKYWFVMPSLVQYDEYKLEQDFQYFLGLLSQNKADYFLFRDFQARNIMISPANPAQLYYIDYQGARQGALQYDVASLLYQAKADLAQPTRDKLFEYYLEALQNHIRIDDVAQFRADYDNFVLLRLLQVLGSYGYRGFYERKPHFLSSIPYALQNIEQLMARRSDLFAAMPQLSAVLRQLINGSK